MKAPQKGFPQTNHDQGVKHNPSQYDDMAQSLAPIVDGAVDSVAPVIGRHISDYNVASEPNGDHQGTKSGPLEFPPRS